MEIIGGDSDSDLFISQWKTGCESFRANTSGSTGEPKKINLLRSDMICSARATCDFFDLNENSVILSPLSASYIAGKMMLVRGFLADCTVIMETPSNQPVKENYGVVDLLSVVPSQVLWILNTDCQGTRLKNVIVGGAPLACDIEKKLMAAPFSCYATYGMTETCSHVALRKMGNPYFTAMPGVSFSSDGDGRLIISSSRYSFGSLLTNDVVELKTDTEFRWIGRYDNVIMSGGVKLHPEEIEKELASIISAPFYLVGEPHYKWGTALVLYVEDLNFDTERLRSSMKLKLHPYQVPRDIRVVSKFKRTDSGKIKRVLL